ncbi:MAG TPA: C-terminal binding protein [Solirubrobacteraceae bacterium]|nr:C-terminal binding protein [Solirubrobacteraceae bacterium]
MAGAPATRVLADAAVDLDALRAELEGTGARVEAIRHAPAGDDVVGLVAFERPVGEAELARLPALRVLVTPSVGFDHLDLDAARRHGGTWVCHVADYCVDEMADTALALVLALMRGVVALDRHVRAGGWDAAAAGRLRRVRGTRLGVVGYGCIGAALARRACVLGFEVWAADPALTAPELERDGVRLASLEELLGACHVVSLHAPLTARTRGLIGADELGLMPRGALLVNTARAGLLDTAAVLDALASGRLGGAALDVLDVEPPTAEHPAPRAPNLIVTPHSAYASAEADAELQRRVGAAIRAVLEGRPPAGALVSPSRR